MPDQVAKLTKRFTSLTYQIVSQQAQFITGIVLSRNVDGTLNVDDGLGGCVLVVPPSNTRVGDRIIVDKGSLIQGIGMPGARNYTLDIPQKNRHRTFIFVDENGYGYNRDTGASLGPGFTPAAPDPAFDYHTHAGGENDYYCGNTAPAYTDFVIGTNTGIVGTTTGFGSVQEIGTGSTRLCQGQGPSGGILLGVESLLDYTSGAGGIGGDDHGEVWMNIRDAVTFALLHSVKATWITTFLEATTIPFTNNSSLGPSWAYIINGYHVTADPDDGTFWIGCTGGGIRDDTDPGIVFHISAVGALIDTGISIQPTEHPWVNRIGLLLMPPT